MSFALRPQYIKSSMQILMYDAEDFFELLNSHDQEITLDNHVDIWKKKKKNPPRQSWRTWALALGEDYGGFEADWIHYSWHQSVSEYWFEQVAVNN